MVVLVTTLSVGLLSLVTNRGGEKKSVKRWFSGSVKKCKSGKIQGLNVFIHDGSCPETHIVHS